MPNQNSLKVHNKVVELHNIDSILKHKKMQLLLKRVFDLLIAFLGLVCLSPLFLFIAIIIKLDSRGPVLFKQIRVGKNGRTFKILKFRTMVVDAEKKGMQITVGKDTRITRSGQLLRKYKLDELPQLFNVLIGDMSFVGPRPEVPKYVALYNKEQRNILKIKPGITDLASIEFRDESNLLARSENPEETYIDEIMPHKIELNIEYIKRMSLYFDIKLIIKTILVIFR